MAKYFRQLAPADQLRLFKKVKGYYLFEGGVEGWNVNYFKPILDEKAVDVHDALDYDFVNYEEVYKDYVNRRY